MRAPIFSGTPAGEPIEEPGEEPQVTRAALQAKDPDPIVLARDAAPAAMRRLIKQSENERDPRVRLAANQAVLKYAGIEPPKRLEITTPDRVIEQMTAQELEDLAERRVWPARFREVLRAFLPAPALVARERPGETVVDVTPTHPDTPPAAAPDLSQFAEELGLRK